MCLQLTKSNVKKEPIKYDNNRYRHKNKQTDRQAERGTETE